MITRQQQRKKYEADEKYHAACDDFSQTAGNRYSLRHYYGRRFEEEKTETIVRFINAAGLALRGARIIDLGCHYGRIAGLWAGLKGSAKDVHGADFIADFVKTASAINPGIKFFRHDLYGELPFKDGFFDIVSMIYVFNSISAADQPLIAGLIEKKIKSGGHIIVFDFYASRAVRMRQQCITLLRRLAGKPEKGYLPRLDRGTVRRLFPDCEVVAERKVMNMFSYVLLRFGRIVPALSDRFLPAEYYAAILRKK